MQQPELLGDYIRRMMFQKGLNGAEVSRRSKRGSKRGISREYISQLKNSQSFNPSKDKLAALARGLDVPIDELLRVALQNSQPATNRFALLISQYAEMPSSKKALAEPMIQMLEREMSRLLCS